MIGQLAGTIVADDADGTVVIDVGGVGYEVTVPLGALGRARALSAGSERVTLYVHTHVRDDAIALFGFTSAAEKEAFRVLISVSNVGPKIALAILSAMPVEELGRAVAGRDLAKLVSIPGVGKKTAERLMLELKDKLPASDLAAALSAAKSGAPAAAPDRSALVISALTRLGYRAGEAERAVAALGSKVDSSPVGELIREALAVLAR